MESERGQSSLEPRGEHTLASIKESLPVDGNLSLVPQAREVMCCQTRDASAYPELVRAVRLKDEGSTVVLVVAVVGRGEKIVLQLPDGNEIGVWKEIYLPRPPPECVMQYLLCRGEDGIPWLYVNQRLPWWVLFCPTLSIGGYIRCLSLLSVS